MASIGFYSGRWSVQWYVDRRHYTRRFGSEEEARAFVAAGDFTPSSTNRRHGKAPRTRAQVIEHIAQNFEVDDSGCWIWSGSRTDEGYARMSWKRDNITHSGGHRVVLAAIGDVLPDGLVVDHLCRNRACVNPDHLEMVIQRENVMRSPVAPGALNAAKTHCAQGHPFSTENTRTYFGHGGRSTSVRVCKTCERARYERRRAQRMGAVA